METGAAILTVVTAAVVVVLAGLLLVTVRRYLLERGGGTVECSLRQDPGGKWRLGFARYHVDDLRWYRVFALWPWPSVVLSRRGLIVDSRRRPTEAALVDLAPDSVVVACAALVRETGPGTEPVAELAMSEAAVTGFLSWLESSPPGTHFEKY